VKARLRILIAEDNLEMREFIFALLKPEFEVVRTVSNGRDLVREALALLPDVIVSDTSMPLLGGISAMNELRATGKDIPVVVVSGVFRRAGISRYPGALVYVDKSDLALDLITAVQSAKSGQSFLSRSIRLSPPESPE
jgi:two-component system invasion response regulator UvrY